VKKPKVYTRKEKMIREFTHTMLNKTLTMFEYTGLPDSLPAVELEKQLQQNGYSVIAQYDGNIYAFQAGFSGQDVYYRPTQAIINNPALKFNATLDLNTDCILIKNDDMQKGLLYFYKHYGTLLTENELTMLLADYNLRMPSLISANDDNTIENAQAYLSDIVEGKVGVIGESKLFDSLKVQPTADKGSSNFADMYGYQQYLLATLNNEIGLATNNNMKKERLTTNEVDVNQNATYPLIDNMLRNRQEALAKINDLFGTDISVKFSSIWDSSDANVTRETIDDSQDDDIPDQQTLDDETDLTDDTVTGQDDSETGKDVSRETSETDSTDDTEPATDESGDTDEPADDSTDDSTDTEPAPEKDSTDEPKSDEPEKQSPDEPTTDDSTDDEKKKEDDEK